MQEISDLYSGNPFFHGNKQQDVLGTKDGCRYFRFIGCLSI